MNKKALLVVFCVLLPVLIILFSYKMVFWFTGYDSGQQEVVDFLREKGELPAGVSAGEESHLEDVQGVMKIVDYVFYGLLLVCSLLVTLNYKDKKNLKKMLKYGGIASLSSWGLFLLVGLIGFNWLFEMFHKVFFPQGNWQFSMDSFLIQTFPIKFFIWMFVKIVVLSLVLGVICIASSKFLKQ